MLAVMQLTFESFPVHIHPYFLRSLLYVHSLFGTQRPSYSYSFYEEYCSLVVCLFDR